MFRLREFNARLIGGISPSDERLPRPFQQPDADFGSICRDLIEAIDFRNAFGRAEKNVRRLMIPIGQP